MEYDEVEILQGVLAKISLNHNQILLDRIKIKKQRLWYAKESIENIWSRPVIVHQIESKLYERQGLLEKSNC